MSVISPSDAPGEAAGPAALQPDDFDALDALLDGVRERGDSAPQWEFCEGFMAALLCCRSAPAPAAFWPVLFDTEAPLQAVFADAAACARFESLWAQRWREVEASLDAEVDSLDDDRTYCPQVLDTRSALALLDLPSRAQALGLQDEDEAGVAAAMAELPSFAQLWALGFMTVVEAWPDEWQVPGREKDIASAVDEALHTVALLCEDDEGPPAVSGYVTDDDEDGPPSMSVERLEAFGEAIWAVYALRDAARALGPRVAQVRREAAAPGRNDPCPCGSGKKYKKCHGAG